MLIVMMGNKLDLDWVHVQDSKVKEETLSQKLGIKFTSREPRTPITVSTSTLVHASD